MSKEFEFIYDDFSNELDALSEMAVVRSVAARAGLTPRARIAASNGATLLLAATFEEYVRQQVKAAFNEKTRRATSISDFPKNIASTVWKRALESLSRTPFEEIEADVRAVNGRISSVVEFCLKKEIGADIGDALAHNDNNMRSDQISKLFNQIGIQNIIQACCDSKELQDHLGVGSRGAADAVLRQKIDEFFKRRNTVAHAIKMGSSSGPAELSQDIELFRKFGRALAETIEASV